MPGPSRGEVYRIHPRTVAGISHVPMLRIKECDTLGGRCDAEVYGCSVSGMVVPRACWLEARVDVPSSRRFKALSLS